MDANRPEEIDFVFVSCFSVAPFISFFFFWNDISISLLIYEDVFGLSSQKRRRKKRCFWTFPWR